MIFRKIKKNKGIICGDNNTIVNYAGDNNSNVVQVQNYVGDNNSNVAQVQNVSSKNIKRYELQILRKNGKVQKHKYKYTDIYTFRSHVEAAMEEKENGSIKDFYLYVNGKEINVNNFDKEEPKKYSCCNTKRYKDVF